MKIAKEKLDELSQKANQLIGLKREFDNLVEHNRLLFQRTQSAEASNQQLSKEHAKISNVAQKFAEHKERDAETIAKLTGMLESAFKANQRLVDERDTATKALEESRPDPE